MRLDADTLDVIDDKTFLTASHCWDNSIQISQSGHFLGMVLGDGNPRGIRLWQLDASTGEMKNKMVYYCKVKHMTSSTRQSGSGPKTYPKLVLLIAISMMRFARSLFVFLSLSFSLCLSLYGSTRQYTIVSIGNLAH